MFQLEDSIQDWLRALRKHRAYDDASTYELELHLRDHIDDLINQGQSEKEAFEKAVRSFGDIPSVAKEEYWTQKRKPTITSMINSSIHRNFYSIAIRNLIKHRVHFGINILGLSIGIASFIFIVLYVVNELSYDQFHSNHQRIYTVTTPATIRGEDNHDARSSNPLANTLLAEYPQIENSTRLLHPGPILISEQERLINEEGLLYVDERFLEVFDFDLESGKVTEVLSEPRSLVLTSSFAKKYFGNENPIGKDLALGADKIAYQITGVIEDCPANSHIQFDMLASLASRPEWNSDGWIGGKVYTYAQLDKETDPADLEPELMALFYQHMAPEIEYFTGMSIQDWEGAGNRVGYKLTPIRDIHLNSTFTAGALSPAGNSTYVNIYLLIGGLILIVAIFNFINLATAYSSTRAREVGVRKVMGSSKSQLIYQFVVESILVAVVSTFIASLLVMVMMPEFTSLIGKDLAFHITDHYAVPLLLLGLALLVGLMAGIYPAVILSSYKSAEVLKGKISSGVKSGWLRNSLVTLQFSVAAIIVIGTVVIYDQLNFMLNKSLGFDKEQILVIEKPDWLGNNLEIFEEELTRRAEVTGVTNSLTLPGKRFEVRSYRKKDEREVFLFLNNQVNYDYLQVMGLELVKGRFFSKEFKGDSNAVVINESAAAAFAFTDPIGQPLSSAFKKGRPLKVIGVVKDYHLESLHKPIMPASLELDSESQGFLTVKIAAGQPLREVVGFIEDSWTRYSNGKPLEYFFFDDDFAQLYQTESITGRVLVLFASLSIFIACLGLIGLVTLTTAARTREIGIRKVLGAGSLNLMLLLSKETIRLLAISTLVSWPLAYLGCNYWLQNFASRTYFNPLIYLFSTTGLTAIIALTIGLQSLKVVKRNPVESLHQE